MRGFRHLLASVLFAILAIGMLRPDAVRAAGPERISFPGKAGVMLRGALYMPDGGAGPFPAVVALHGCGGLDNPDGTLNLRHADWGERLSRAGFIVLLPDSFGSRGLGSQCRNAERNVRPRVERTADAFAAKAYLQGRPDVKASAVNLLGWSNGGSTVLYASAASPPDAGPGFARAVAFYPGCRLPAERSLVPRMPLLILVGANDDWTGAEPCERFAKAAQASGAQVVFVAYPGAYHDFDHPNLPVRERRGLAFTVLGNGAAHAGTNAEARADALAKVPAFLAR